MARISHARNAGLMREGPVRRRRAGPAPRFPGRRRGVADPQARPTTIPGIARAHQRQTRAPAVRRTLGSAAAGIRTAEPQRPQTPTIGKTRPGAMDARNATRAGPGGELPAAAGPPANATRRNSARRSSSESSKGGSAATAHRFRTSSSMASSGAKSVGPSSLAKASAARAHSESSPAGSPPDNRWSRRCSISTRSITGRSLSRTPRPMVGGPTSWERIQQYTILSSPRANPGRRTQTRVGPDG